jgi:transcriptional regulator with XRE-family HTH domain
MRELHDCTFRDGIWVSGDGSYVARAREWRDPQMDQPVNVEAFADVLFAWTVKKLARRTYIAPSRLTNILGGHISPTNNEVYMLAGALRLEPDARKTIFGKDRVKRMQLRILNESGFKPKIIK